jgi:hypothetical protein
LRALALGVVENLNGMDAACFWGLVKFAAHDKFDRFCKI